MERHDGPATRRPRGSLTAEVILDAAEDAASQGFDALTLRAVATKLGASPMALYRYFPTKRELLDAMTDRVLGRVPAPPQTDDWRSDLAFFARGHAGVLIANSWVITPLFTSPNPGLNANVIGEGVLAVLERGGITGADAVAAFSAILAFNYGWVSFAAPHLPPAALHATLTALPVQTFRRTVAFAEPMSRYAGEDNYERALSMLVSGISSS